MQIKFLSAFSNWMFKDVLFSIIEINFKLNIKIFSHKVRVRNKLFYKYLY